MAGSCEDGNNLLGSIKHGETEYLTGQQLLKYDSVPWAELFSEYMKVGMRSFHSCQVYYNFRKYIICCRKCLCSRDLVTLLTEVRFVVTKENLHMGRKFRVQEGISNKGTISQQWKTEQVSALVPT